MRRIRRKRQKYTWMPTLGGQASNGDTHFFTSWFGGKIEANSAYLGPTDLYVSPVVPDYTLFPGSAAGAATSDVTLKDFTEGQDWILKRIVGRLNLGLELIEDAGTDTTPAFVMVGAGFYVGRADDTAQDIPDGSNFEIDPLASNNIRQPWIWRRTWLLRNGLVRPSSGFFPTAPVDNGEMTGALGPIIDSKIARRIRREERLWFVLNAYGGNQYACDARAGGGPYPTPGVVQFNLDYRILGQTRKSTNRSTFG